MGAPEQHWLCVCVCEGAAVRKRETVIVPVIDLSMERPQIVTSYSHFCCEEVA